MFTARYAQSPSIKETRFVFECLRCALFCTWWFVCVKLRGDLN